MDICTFIYIYIYICINVCMHMIGLVIIVLSELFADTLFFGIFYPSDGTCDVHTTEVSHF
jgi:hypothetical protein